MYLLVLCLIGLVVGALARLALPGRDPMSLWQTMAIGIGGSLLAGIVARLLFNLGMAHRKLGHLPKHVVSYFLQPCALYAAAAAFR